MNYKHYKHTISKLLTLTLALILTTGLFGCGASATNAGDALSTDVASADTTDTNDSSDIKDGESSTGKTASDEASADNEQTKEAASENKESDENTDRNSSDNLNDNADMTSTEDDEKTTGNTNTADDSKGKTDEDSSVQEPVLPEYTVEEWSTPKTYYTTISLNVRKGPSTAFDIIGCFAFGQEVTVKGQASTGWYLVSYNGEDGFASNNYCQETPPIVEYADPVPNPETAPVAETPIDNATPAPAPAPVAAPAGIIFVGDSRFVQMHETVGDNGITWICEPAKGYNWFCETAIGRIDNHVGKGTKILINLGVNDTNNANNYIGTINNKTAEWVSRGAKVYFASVNPVWDNPHVTEEQVQNFNNCMIGGLSGVHYINSHDYLISIGYNAVDGLHYDANTYTNIYNYLISNMK